MKDDRGELDLTKQIEILQRKVRELEGEISVIKGINLTSPEYKSLTSEIKRLKNVEESHRKLNGKLQHELSQVKIDNVILADDNATLMNRLREKGL